MEERMRGRGRSSFCKDNTSGSELNDQKNDPQSKSSPEN